MSIIVMPRWNIQPPPQIKIDWSKPITRNLIGAVINGIDALDYTVTKDSGIVQTPGPKGLMLGGFNGTSLKVSINHPLIINPFTVAFTMLYKSGTGVRAYVAQGGGATSKGWFIGSASNADTLRITSSGINSLFANSILINNAVHRIVVSIDALGFANCWIDGKYQGTVIPSAIVISNTSTSIGASYNTAYTNFILTGSLIDNVQIYSRALTTVEIANDYFSPYSIYLMPNRKIIMDFAGMPRQSLIWNPNQMMNNFLVR